MEAVEFNPVAQPLFDTIDRSAIMILPGEIYYNWGRCVNEGNIALLFPEPQLFLIPNFETPEETSEFIETFYDLIFRHELERWSVDPAFWPINRTYEMFRNWFEIKLIYHVRDTLCQPICKESEEFFCEEPHEYNWFEEYDFPEHRGWGEDLEDNNLFSYCPKPGLCLTCCKENEEEEEFMCYLVRKDQWDAEEFICDEYEPLN
jgi:hypothetical protein